MSLTATQPSTWMNKAGRCERVEMDGSRCPNTVYWRYKNREGALCCETCYNRTTVDEYGLVTYSRDEYWRYKKKKLFSAGTESWMRPNMKPITTQTQWRE